MTPFLHDDEMMCFILIIVCVFFNTLIVLVECLLGEGVGLSEKYGEIGGLS